MDLQLAVKSKRFGAELTLIRPLAAMNPEMFPQVGPAEKQLVADVTLLRLLATVGGLVALQLGPRLEQLGAVFALVEPTPMTRPLVAVQIRAGDKGLAATVTGKRLDAEMLVGVAAQLGVGRKRART